MKIVLLGMNHESAPVEVREQLAVDEPGPLLRKLTDCEEIDEAVLFSTCNRVEVVALTRSLDLLWQHRGAGWHSVRQQRQCVGEFWLAGRREQRRSSLCPRRQTHRLHKVAGSMLKCLFWR